MAKEVKPPKVDGFKKWLESMFNDLIQHFLVDFVHISVRYMEENRTQDNGNVVFNVEYIPHYHVVYINVYPFAKKMWKKGKKDELVHGAIHELSHMHTIPLEDLANKRYASRHEIQKESEHLTEVIAEYIRRYIDEAYGLKNFYQKKSK